jgi:hypothetical protein
MHICTILDHYEVGLPSGQSFFQLYYYGTEFCFYIYENIMLVLLGATFLMILELYFLTNYNFALPDYSEFCTGYI